jgi:hypothetical protein
VNYFERRDLQVVTETKLSAGDNRMRNDLRQPPAKMRGLKDVFENAADVDPRSFIGIETQGAMPKIQRPNVIKAKDVIGVTVRYQHRVKVLESDSQSLLTKITRGVNNYRLTRVFDKDRHSQALVARVFRSAGLAITGDRGNSG